MGFRTTWNPGSLTSRFSSASEVAAPEISSAVADEELREEDTGSGRLFEFPVSGVN